MSSARAAYWIMSHGDAACVSSDCSPSHRHVHEKSKPACGSFFYKRGRKRRRGLPQPGHGNCSWTQKCYNYGVSQREYKIHIAKIAFLTCPLLALQLSSAWCSWLSRSAHTAEVSGSIPGADIRIFEPIFGSKYFEKFVGVLRFWFCFFNLFWIRDRDLSCVSKPFFGNLCFGKLGVFEFFY